MAASQTRMRHIYRDPQIFCALSYGLHSYGVYSYGYGTGFGFASAGAQGRGVLGMCIAGGAAHSGI